MLELVDLNDAMKTFCEIAHLSLNERLYIARERAAEHCGCQRCC